MTATNNFKATGIKGLTVSWRQDVLPLVTKLQAEGLKLDINRKKETNNKGYTYRYDVLVDDIDAEDRVYFTTNAIGSVWTYLLGIVESQKRLPLVRKVERSEKVCVIPSESYLKDLIGRSVLGSVTENEKKLLRWYNGMVQEAYDEGRLKIYSGPTDWGRWVKDVQSALLDSENIKTWQQWIEKNGNAHY